MKIKLIKKLHSLISVIWTEERRPRDWNCGTIWPLYKKEDPPALECYNYRGITLLTVAYKIFSTTIPYETAPICRKRAWPLHQIVAL